MKENSPNKKLWHLKKSQHPLWVKSGTSSYPACFGGWAQNTKLLSSHLTSSTSSPVGWSKIFHLIYWLPSLVGWNEIFHVIHWVPQSHCALCSKFRFQQFRPAGSAWLPNSAGNSMEFCAIPWNSVQFLGTITPRGPAADCTQKPQIHKSAPAPEPSWELNT